MDIYFKEEYAKIYELNGDGKVEKFNFESDDGRAEYIFLKRHVEGETETYYDITTPYGYGGPVFYPQSPENLSKLISDFRREFEVYCKKNKIISEFIRFHPLLDNHKHLEDYLEVTFCHNTISINLNNEEQIFSEMSGKARNKVRKALKNNVTIKKEYSKEKIKKFIEMYYETMDKNNASNYYYFDKEYFKNLFELGKDKVVLFNAYHEEDIVAATTILKGRKYIHYHLSANTKKGYQLAANNLLLFEVAKWGGQNGYKNFHLGGGHDGEEDALFKFKSSFNKAGALKFYIGKKVHNPEAYSSVNEFHERKRPEIKEKDLDFFPLYRR